MPGNTADRYVTWAITVPGDVAVPAFPQLKRWGMPVWFPDPETFFPKDVVPMYAIRNTTAGVAHTLDGGQVDAPAGVWFTYTDGSGYSMVSDDYFYGGTPDTSGGTQYPTEAQRDIDPETPQWAQDGTMPPAYPDADPAPLAADTAPTDTPEESPA